MAKFILIQGIVIGIVFIPCFLLFDDFFGLILYWFGSGVASVPFYIRIIPTIIISAYVVYKLKSQDFTSISGYSLIIFYSFAITSITYWRYLLGLIYNGTLDKRFDKFEWNIKKLNITLDKHELTFILSIVGVIISILTVLTGLIEIR
jgi:hypothetical protein